MAKRSKSTRRPRRNTRSTEYSREPLGAHSPSDAVASQLDGVQRKLWQAGASALARGSKIGGPISPVALAESLQGGMRKLEEVFDQRVLTSLAHAGMPSPQEMRELMERVDNLSADVKRLSGKRPRKSTKR